MTCSTAPIPEQRKMTNIFERYLTVWVALCIGGGILLGKLAPNLAKTLDGLAISVNGAPVVSIPIAICLFFMMYPIMVKIDFASVIRAGKSGKPVWLTLFINWAVKPFSMALLGWLCQRRSKNRPRGGAKVGHCGAGLRPPGGLKPERGSQAGAAIF